MQLFKNSCQTIVLSGLATGILLVIGCGPTRQPGNVSKKVQPSDENPSKDSAVVIDESQNREFFITYFYPTKSRAHNVKGNNFSKTSLVGKDIESMHEKFFQPGLTKLEKALAERNDSKANQKLTFAKDCVALFSPSEYVRGINLGIQLAERAEKLVPQVPEKEDPFFNMCLAKAFEKHDPIMAMSLSNAAVGGFEKSDYPCRYAIHAHFVRKMTEQSKRQFKNTYRKQLAETLLYWLTQDLQCEPDQYRFAANHIRDVVGYLRGRPNELDAVLEVFQEDDRIPRYLREFALGCIYNRKAWDARGDGSADTVSAEGWKLFERHQRKAAVHFRNAHRINDRFPHHSYEMIDIARAGNIGESVEEWYGNAINAQFDFMPAYDGMIFNLYPRWNGSEQQMLAFGKQCLDTERFDTLVPAYYLNALMRLSSLKVGGGQVALRSVYRDPQILKDAERCVEGYLAAEDAPKVELLSKRYLYSELAVIAYHANRLQVAKKYFDLLDGDISSRALDRHYGPKSPKDLRALVDASLDFGSSNMRGYRLALRRADSLEKKSELLGQVVERKNAAQSDSVKHFWAVEQQKLNDRIRFERGKWVDKLFTNGLGAWTSKTNAIAHTANPDELEITLFPGSLRYNYSFELDTDLAGPKIIEYTIEQTKKYLNHGMQSAKVNFRPGIAIIGTEKTSFYITHDLQLNQIGFAGGGQPFRFVRCPSKSNKFEIRCGGTYVEVRQDGELVLRNRLANVGDGVRFVLKNLTGVGGVRYRDVRIKKWELGPPPVRFVKERDVPQIYDYFKQGTELEPDNGEHWKHLGMLQYRNKEFDAARQSFENALQRGLNKRIIGFYLGDMLEREGNLKAARQEYYESAKETQRFEITPEYVITSDWANPHRRAALRYTWLFATDPDNWDMSKEEAEKHFGPIVSIAKEKKYPLWATRKVEAARYALRQRFKQAAGRLKTLKDVPPEIQDEINQQIAAYESGKQYQPSADTPSFYLSIKHEPFFYRYWDHILPQDLAFRHR